MIPKPSQRATPQTDLHRRRVLGMSVALGAGLAIGAPSLGRAQAAFPSRPIRIVVPYSAGTGSDLLARTVGQSITEKTGHTVVVENREGGGSLIGTQAVATAAPDGYTLLIAANPVVIVPGQSSKPAYDPIRDFVAVAKVGVIPLVLAVNPGLNLNSVKDLVAYAKANPGKLNYGSSGIGAPSHLMAEFLKLSAGLDMVHIP